MTPRLILLLLCLFGTATALPDLPDLEETRRLLGSPDFKERETLTLELWERGPEVIPLLRSLSDDRNPEVAMRASFLLERLQMGLGPQADDGLLLLAEQADQAPFEERSSRLHDLLEHEQGFIPGLFFLNQWLSQRRSPPEHRISLSELFVEPLFEKRSDWKDFLTYPFSSEARAFLIGALCIQETPAKSQMVAILANDDLREIHRVLSQYFRFVPPETDLTFARLAVLREDLDLALGTLSRQLLTRENPDPARAMAFLEMEAGLAPIPHEGKGLPALQLLRARAREEHARTIELANSLGGDPLLAYESRVLAGSLAPPSPEEAALLAGTDLLPVWKLAFGRPPGQPDIEALTSDLVIPWTDLARLLTALAHPVEAAERLAAEEQPDSAINLLWRTGHPTRALELARNILTGIDPDLHSDVRLTLAFLFLESGDVAKAREFFEPVITTGIRDNRKRARAVQLGLRFLPLETVTDLEPNLNDSRAFRRQQAADSFLNLPRYVASSWYEHFRNDDPSLGPVTLLKKIQHFLEHERPAARKIVTTRIAETSPKLLPGEPLYQNAFYLQTEGALAMVLQAAWQQLSTRDLLRIVRSPDWSLPERKTALATALQLDPANPVVRWFDLELNGVGDPGTITRATLGNPSLALQLGRLTGKRESLATAARVASFTDPDTLRGLAVLGKSHLEQGEPARAARLLQASLVGGFAMGTQPAPRITETLETITALYRAHLLTAVNEATREVWRERLAGLGHAGLATE